MNIFALDLDPTACARYHTDAHCVKMRLESAQLLISALHRLRGVFRKNKLIKEYINTYFLDFPRKDKLNNPSPYGLGYINHGCCLWVSKSLDNFTWLNNLGIELCKEHEHRYGLPLVSQKTYLVLSWIKNNTPSELFKNINLTPFHLAIADDCKSSNSTLEESISAYKGYYNKYKRHLFKWSNREVPSWIK